ncbi:hypothetical protein V5799_012162 [Amblyomma americanum]|uniref:Peptidase S1 domain-containing protein n=1 Tax=Amblyomma americanum TaxID=6943 RepID=A0AAQ4EF36_AMBAM
MKFLLFGANLLLGVVTTVYLTVEANGGTFGCGGSIITKFHVLTTSRCISNRGLPVKRIQVSYGSNLLATTKKVDVEKLYVHPGSSSEYGVAILRVKQPFQFSIDVQHVKLPEGTHEYTGARVAAPLWSSYTSGPKGATHLVAVFQTIERNDVCKRRSGPLYRTDIMYCAKQYPTKSGKGFSGGPWTIRGKDGRSVLIGMGSSITYGCLLHDVVIRVDAFMPWIRRTIQGENAQKKPPSSGHLLDLALTPYYFSSDTPALEPVFY